MEKDSEHPIAAALVKKAREENLTLEPVEDFRAEPGFGVAAAIGGRRVLIGNYKLMEKHGVAAGGTGWNTEGPADGTTVFVALDGKPAGYVVVADALKESAAGAAARLKKDGLRLVMLTGDTEGPARAVAAAAGIDRVISGVPPGGKEEIIRELQASGEVVAMVGDGINDAPALARADLGIAIGSGTDVAVQAADVTLMRENLEGVPDALRLSRATMSTIRWNLFWAFGYNAVCIPVAAGVLYPFFHFTLNPMIASAAMAFSSVSVVANSLRLKNRKL